MRKILLKLIAFLFILKISSAFAQNPRNAIQFDGSDDYVETERIMGEFHTIEFWVKFDRGVNGVNANDPVITFDSDVSNRKWLWSNSCCSAFEDETLSIHNGHAGGNFGVSSMTETVSSGWHHIAIVSNKDVSLPIENENTDGDSFVSSYIYSKIYIDGEEIILDLNNGGASIFKSRKVFLATRLITNSFKKLAMDEVRIWSVPRTQNEIREYMTKKLQGTETGLLAYYQFDQTSGTTLNDETSTNNATLHNIDFTETSGWIDSGAAIGDESTFIYASDFSVSSLELTSSFGNLKVDNLSGDFSGIHLYKISDKPNSTNGILSSFSDNYVQYGVFFAGTKKDISYRLTYDYTGYASAEAEENLLDLYIKRDNSISHWGNMYASTITLTDEVQKTLNFGRSEIVLGKRNGDESFEARGPAGIGNIDGSSSLKLWLNGHNMEALYKEPTVNNALVEYWKDLSGNLNDYIQENNIISPQTRFNFNGYPAGRFRNGSFMDSRNTQSFNEGQLVVVLRGYVHDHISTSKILSNDDVSVDFYTRETISGTEYYRPSFTNTSTHLFATDQLLNRTFLSYKKNSGSNSIDFEQYVTDNTISTLVSGDNSFPIQKLGDSFRGLIAEVIFFDTPLNQTQEIILKNYLSAKYKTGISSDNFYKMDQNNRGNFDHHFAGIGQISSTDNHVKARGTGILEISNPSDLNDNEFLMWGSNNRTIENLDLAFDTFNFTTRVNSLWRLNKVGDLGTVSMVFDLSTLDLTEYESACTKMHLRVSNQLNLGTNTSYELIRNDKMFSIDNVILPNEAYFTIDYVSAVGWNGYSFKNGSGTNNAPSMTDSCFPFIIDSQNTSAMVATLTENATVKSLEVKAGNTLVIEEGIVLYVENEIQLDGDIRLLGDAQIIQNHTGNKQVSGNGNLYVQRKSKHGTKFSIQYLSSPVSIAGTTSHDVTDVLHTGGNYDMTLYGGYEGITAISTHPDYAYTQDPYGASVSPLQLSDYWFWKFVNGATFDDWKLVRESAVTVNAGEGFSIKGPGRKETYVFIGTPNDGIITSTIGAGNESLLGNPYPSVIDGHEFLKDNLSPRVAQDVIDGTLYFWDQISASGHGISSYEGGFATLNLLTSVKAVHINSGAALTGAKTPKRFIPIGQGFFVKGSANGGTITFKNSQRTFKTEASDETTLFRTSEDDLAVLKLSLGHYTDNAELANRQIAIGFKNGLTENHEQGYDSEMIDEQPTDFYSKFEGNEKKYVIAGISKFSFDKEIPLVVKAEKDGVYEFKMDEKVGISAKVYLKDKELQTTFELTEVSLEFILEQGVYKNRFSIVFEEESTLNVEDLDLENTKVYFSENSQELIVQTSLKLQGIKMYNLLGQKILEEFPKAKEEIYTIPISKNIHSGVYIVNVFTEKGQKSFKIKI
ncbi:T9SS type A sorting domain-containing protein [Aureivirga marina]|uniref:T9SS type A sorting domain-containing protein n=1 Tax=Aureivirga marina TaxID=1182451 RepID=UPI0018C928C6|nr:LamG-like jellyroll fold domain-containing protein [Aureivirga marina]